MENYKGEEIFFNGCAGCAYANHEFSIPCGIAYEKDGFTISQDWELPIEGFYIVSPIRHVEKFEELSADERNKMFDLVDKTIKILRLNNVCDRFEIIFEEKENRHLHVWIMPRHEWMRKVTDEIIDNIGTVLNYAKDNFRNEDTYKRIDEVNKTMKEELNR